MFKCTSILLSSGNHESLAKFYEAVFEKPADPMMGWEVGGVSIVVMEHSEIHGKSKEGPRVMFNLETKDVPKAFERIKNIAGVGVIKEPYQMTMEGKVVAKEDEKDDGFWIATISDPDGNYFQLMSPWDPS
jgi:predicted enzyme related to lactoylglutathione lyase